MPPPKVKDPFIPVVVIIAAVAAAGGYYYLTRSESEPVQTSPPSAAAEKAPPPSAAAEPEIRYPIEGVESERPAEPAAPLPPRRESDETLRAAAAELIGAETLARFFNIKEIVRRFVVTVEELPRRKVGQRYNLVKPVPESFIVSGKDETMSIGDANYGRYTSYVVLAETVPTEKLVALYVRFYPLFQEEYEDLGYPKRYFNDRVVEAIDDMLAAPEIDGPIALRQPKVLYEYADPAIEGLSAGQKIMIRMGSENAAKMKPKLREIRTAITAAR